MTKQVCTDYYGALIFQVSSCTEGLLQAQITCVGVLIFKCPHKQAPMYATLVYSSSLNGHYQYNKQHDGYKNYDIKT